MPCSVHQLPGILNAIERERDILAILPGGQGLQILSSGDLDKGLQWYIIHPTFLLIRSRSDQGCPQDLVDRQRLASDRDRQILLEGAQGCDLVLLKSGFQGPLHLRVAHPIKKQLIPIDRQVQLVLESDTHRIHTGPPSDLASYRAQISHVGRLAPVIRTQFGHQVGLTRDEQFLEHGRRWRKGEDRIRIVFPKPLVERQAQRFDLLGRPGPQVKLRLRDRQFLLLVQQELLLSYIGRMRSALLIEQPEQLVDPVVVLIQMDILVPIHMHDQLLLVDLRHPALGHLIEQPGAQRDGHHDREQTPTLMTEDKLNSGIIETIQCPVVHHLP